METGINPTTLKNTLQWDLFTMKITHGIKTKLVTTSIKDNEVKEDNFNDDAILQVQNLYLIVLNQVR